MTIQELTKTVEAKYRTAVKFKPNSRQTLKRRRHEIQVTTGTTAIRLLSAKYPSF